VCCPTAIAVFTTTALTVDNRVAPQMPPTRRFIVARPLILCVDDNLLYLNLRKAILEDNGFSVLCATNVADAIATFREAPFCCTIADHLLRGESGVDLARHLKSIKRDVPIILYSGAMPGNLQNIDVYINKDEPTANLLRVIREIIERFSS